MNNRSRKTKGLSRRLIACVLCLLCFVCLIGAAPTIETTVAPEEGQSFYDEVMAAESCQAMYELISDDANYDEASALTAEQVYAVRDYAISLTDDGYQELLVQTLNELLKALGEDVDSEYGAATSASSSSSSGDIDESMYKNTVPVYWDTVSELGQNASSTNGANVETVTLGGTSVTQGNAGTTSWSGGTTLSTYFPEASAGNMKDAAMSITADTGYYVTGVVVACAPIVGGGGGTKTPFSCSTWKGGNEFIQNFNLTNSAYADGKYTLSFDINSKYFSHDGRTTPAAYFILITTAKVPTPLYVEYSYGNVTDFLTVDSNSVFYDPAAWTTAGSGNNYGSGEMYTSGVLTENTQFAYQYPTDDISVIENWSHTANSVSQAALDEAAAKGYYFAGWAVTWYNDCDVTNTQSTENGSYTMTFGNKYMDGTCNPGDSVQLPTNARLVAQWKPITLKVTKTVTGLSDISEFASKTNTYTLQLKNLQNGKYMTLQARDYTITGDGTLSCTFAASGADVTKVITPGTYKVVETGSYDLTGKSENAYCTATYPVQTVTVAADGTVQELKVQNTYSSTPAAYELTVKKTLSGNAYGENEKFSFTVTYGDKTTTFYLGNNEEKQITIPVGAVVTVTEEAKGYTYSLSSVTPESLTYTSQDSGISFTMPSSDVTVVINNEKNITVDSGVFLDTLPYALILAVAVGGAVILIKKRKSHNDD